MTKQNIIDFFSDKYGETADRKKWLHPEIIEKYCELGYNQVIYALMLNAIKYTDYAELDIYLKSFDNQVVYCNEARSEWYCDVPCAVIQLPRGNGVRYISGMKDRLTNFYFRANGDNDVMENLEFSLVNTVPSWYVENSKIFFDHRMNHTLADYGVLIKVYPTFSVWDDDQEIPMPSADNMNIVVVIEQLINQKLTEDTAPNAKSDFPTTK